jgi:glutathione-specific gamma-glutamylcyclotransferase
MSRCQSIYPVEFDTNRALMTKLTRDQLVDGSFRRSLAMPSHLSLSDAELQHSMDTLLASRPDGPIWIFAYGSLIWNPLLSFDMQSVATLDGWHRSFCVRSISARGSQQNPGRVLALEPGGQTMGIAYRLVERDLMTELRPLWAREMASGVYRPTWGTLRLADGSTISAIVFVANPHQELYEIDASVSTVVQLSAKAKGMLGSNTDYILALANAMLSRQIEDDYVRTIADELKQIAGA